MQNVIAKAIEAATSEVFATMIGVEVATEGLSSEMQLDSCQRVVSSFKLSGSARGIAVMSCPAELACLLSSEMLQSQCHSVNPEVMDATGEIANMVVGNVKNVLEHRLGELNLSTPLVQTLIGESKRYSGLPPVTVSFFCKEQRFTVSVIFADEAGNLPLLPENITTETAQELRT